MLDLFTNTQLQNYLKLSKRKRKHTERHIYGMYLFAQVSKAAAELMAYCESHAKEDPLVTPAPSSENPFREKKIFCTIL